MKSNELRIGNYIHIVTKNADEDIPAMLINIQDILENNSIATYSPILLTEEWLMKFDFNKKYFKNPFENGGYELTEDGRKCYSWVHGLFNMEIQSNGEIWFEVYNHYLHVKYVHQLQNLYFALGQKELKITEVNAEQKS